MKGDDREQCAAKRLREKRPTLEAVIRCVERVKNASWDEFRERHGDSGRDLVLHFGRKACGMKLAQLAQAVGLPDYAPVAMALKRFQARIDKPGALCQEWKQVENE